MITSSAAAIGWHDGDEPRTFTEADWNDGAEGEVNGNAFEIYRASKTFAERGAYCLPVIHLNLPDIFVAAWSFYEEQKHTIPWDLATINPPFVYGPPLQPNISSPTEIGGTQSIWWNTVVDTTSEKSRETLGPEGGSAWVDVRDVAEAHVRALEREGAGGERIIVSGGELSILMSHEDDLRNRY